MSKHHEGNWRDDSTCRGGTRPADERPQKRCLAESELAMDRAAPDVRIDIMSARSRSSILAPHVGNCSRAVLLGVGDM
jgi:hypothetical protein